jgi:hypothetical protein
LRVVLNGRRQAFQVRARRVGGELDVADDAFCHENWQHNRSNGGGYRNGTWV